MRYILACYGDPGLCALKHLAEGGLSPIAVFTAKNQDLIYSFCSDRGIRVFSKNINELAQEVLAINPEVIAIASYPFILKPGIYGLPEKGTINLHYSLLPKYRGRHPVNWAIANGESELGATVHYVTDIVDGGDIILQEALPISIHDNVENIKPRLREVGICLLERALRSLHDGSVHARPQNHMEASQAPRRRPEDHEIDWSRPTREIANLIRASTTAYPSYAWMGGQRLEVERVFVPEQAGRVLGQIDDFTVVSTGDGVILVKLRPTECSGKTVDPSDRGSDGGKNG